jgi:catechol 2,3-dioxygenase-like lactoylglutathione lyase family enzyme
LQHFEKSQTATTVWLSFVWGSAYRECDNSTMPATPILRIVPILPVDNLARAIDFYRRLGFSAHRWQDGDSYAFIKRDSLELHLRTAPDLIENQNPCGVYFYLVDGTAAALEAEFRAAGVKVLSPLTPREWKMNEFVLSDPDGNLLRFGEYLLER